MNELVLYHFCAEHMVRSIRRHGLTRGTCPVATPTGWAFISPIQWLTTEPDPRKQSWATRERIKYDRTAYRITVEISEPCRKNLHPAADLVAKLPKENMAMLTGFEGSEKWFVYSGHIPPFWIRSIERMPVIPREGN